MVGDKEYWYQLKVQLSVPTREIKPHNDFQLIHILNIFSFTIYNTFTSSVTSGFAVAVIIISKYNLNTSLENDDVICFIICERLVCSTMCIAR
jgi:hypothetical protein